MCSNDGSFVFSQIMAESTDFPICSVCLEGFTHDGDGCPKLLPCSHTLCESCLEKFRRANRWGPIQCPECRVFHQLPLDGTNGFPTNRYVLHILGLEKKIMVQEKNDVEAILCQVHQKPCVMFCLKKECWKTLCPKCPVQEHQEHNVVSLAECIQESQELKRMKQGVADTRKTLETYEAQVTEARLIVEGKEAEAIEAIEKTATELKLMINKKSAELKKKVRQSCDDELKHLETISDDVIGQTELGTTIEYDIADRSEKNISKGVQQLIQLKNRYFDFQKLARQERREGKNYRLLHFHKNTNQIQYSSLMGDIVSTSHAMSRLRGKESVSTDGGNSTAPSAGSARPASRPSESDDFVGPVRSSRGLSGARRSAPY